MQTMTKTEKSSPMAKTVYRIRNWSEYNKNLVRRGSITLWISEDVITGWKAKPPEKRKRGGQYEYSDLAIESLLLLKSIYHLPLRQAEGFAGSLFELMGVSVKVPNYTTLSRRAVGLKVALPRSSQEPIHVVLDSTGLKVYGEGEWKVRQHGYSKRRTWRKLHLAVDEKSGEIQATVLSEAGLDDAAAVSLLLDEVEAPIKQMSGDGAYDKRKVYEECTKRGIKKVTIPPRRDAKIWQHGNSKEPPLARDENLRRIRQVGRKTWKQESGYHQRSLAETAMFRFKIIFGDHLQARKIEQQITEARIKSAALNRMTQLGMPDSYAVVI